MNIAYLDCFSGISGDMFLGALLDAGLRPEDLFAALGAVGVRPGEIAIAPVVKNGIRATSLEVIPAPDREPLTVSEIRRILGENSLPEPVREKAVEAFQQIVAAESRIHGIQMDDVHLHEISGLDTIVDILGVSFGIHYLGLHEIVSSPVTVGTGTTKIAHGIVPLPVPAVAEILKGVPIHCPGISGEHVTPTGAALAVTFVQRFGLFPPMTVQAIGYGAGQRNTIGRANVLRLFIGETESRTTTGFSEETLLIVETNIDDQTPELTGHLAEKLMTLDGVLDVSSTQIIMKKGRPAVKISILCREFALDTVQKLLFSETSTLGFRYHPVRRRSVPREKHTVETQYGSVAVIISSHTSSPEYEDCKRLAEACNVPVKTVYEAALCAAKLRNS